MFFLKKSITFAKIICKYKMIGTYENHEGYKKISSILTVGTLLFLMYLIYVIYYPIFPKSDIVNNFLYKIHGASPNRLALSLILLLFSISAIFTRTTSKVIDEKTKKTVLLIGLFAYSLFLLLILVLPIGAFTAFLSTSVFMVGFFCLLSWRRKVAEDLKSDRRHEVESQFDQKREIIETPVSVNIPYKYNYLGETLTSWINIINPFRAILVGGTPGSGKSFATIEEIMRQFIKKCFTGVVYDFKYPTLTVKTYNYLKWYEDKYEIKPSFYVINFDDVEYSHRCNPINADSLQTMADAEENTKVLMLNINKTWIDKEGDFFTDSANVFTSMLMWYLKIITLKYDYDVCSFPHLVALTTFESTEILFLILKEYNELKPKMKPFSEALEKGALEQLAGQTASAGIALSKITTKELNYILTGDDFSLDLNNPLAPKILCLGNNPDRQLIYSAPIGLILSKLAKTMNRQKQLPSMYCIDEFPTVYVRGVDNLIATARSNKIATVLGFQSFKQIIVNYGKEISDQLISICGTRIMGQMLDDDAELISKNIGKHKVLNRSYNYSRDDISEGQQTAMEEIVPPERIAQFSQGTFCGVVADDFQYKENNKVFYGELLPPLELKAHEEDISLPKINDFTPDNIDGLVTSYFKNNSNFVVQFKKVLLTNNIRTWVEVIEAVTTERGLDEYLLDTFNFEYQNLKTFTKFISFKTSIQAFILIIKKRDSIDRNFTAEEVDNFVKQSIRQGFINENKNKFLDEYNDEIYNDIYRVIALEIEDLNIVEEIAGNKKLAPYAKSFFDRIRSSDKLTDEVAKQKYVDFIDKIDLAILASKRQ